MKYNLPVHQAAVVCSISCWTLLFIQWRMNSGLRN